MGLKNIWSQKNSRYRPRIKFLVSSISGAVAVWGGIGWYLVVMVMVTVIMATINTMVDMVIIIVVVMVVMVIRTEGQPGHTGQRRQTG